MKISIKPEMYEGYANIPDFGWKVTEVHIDEDDYEFASNPGSGECGMIHIPSDDGAACRYQSVCGDRTGNPLYAWRDWPTGWSSRASVVNVVFDTRYVDCGGYGLDVKVALEYLAENYREPVVVYMRVDDMDLEYGITPWDVRKIGRYSDMHIQHLQLMNPTHPDFVDAAMEFLQLQPKTSKRRKTCYECQAATAWLAPDGRCCRCTHVTPEEVRGE